MGLLFLIDILLLTFLDVCMLRCKALIPLLNNLPDNLLSTSDALVEVTLS